MATDKAVEKIVEVSKGLTIQYEMIRFEGIALLITKEKIKPLIAITWERTHDPSLVPLAARFGVELRQPRQPRDERSE